MSQNGLLECPFCSSCTLPLNKNSCNFPEYKVCPEFQVKLEKLKSASHIIH